MKQTLLTFLFLFSACVVFSQSEERIIIRGQVVSKTNDVENITVYNTSRNVGTITDFDGMFEMEVALHDQLEFSALQFKKVTVVIDAEVIKNRTLTVLLTEVVNTLDEVVILSFGLTGDLKTDMSHMNAVKAMPQYWGDLSHLEFDNEHIDKVDNHLIKKGEFYNGVDFAKLLGLNQMLNKLLSKKKKNIPQWDVNKPNIRGKYSQAFISENFNIPLDRVSAFLNYIEAKGYDERLLHAENEVRLLELLSQESQLFLKRSDEQN